MKITRNGRDTTSNDGLAAYFDSLRDCNPLPREEEVRLAKLKDSGDKDARERMIRSQLRWVVSIAKKFAGGRRSMDDLIQIGNQGLIKAVDRFDHARGCRLTTYTRWWIFQALQCDSAAVENLIHIPPNPVCEPPLCGFIGDIPHKEDSEDALLAVGSVEYSLDDRLDYDALLAKVRRVMLEVLTAREQEVIERRFIGGETLESVGQAVGVTKERIRQIEAKALGRLRRELGVEIAESPTRDRPLSAFRIHPAAAAQARALLDAGELSHRAIADATGVSRSTVWLMAHGHVTHGEKLRAKHSA